MFSLVGGLMDKLQKLYNQEAELQKEFTVLLIQLKQNLSTYDKSYIKNKIRTVQASLSILRKQIEVVEEELLAEI